MSDSEWNWELRLFCSADIVGSTAFKANRTPTSKPEWPATFSEFFSAFPQEVESSYGQLPEKYVPCEKHLSPWKFSGDEILFSVPLHDHTEGIFHIWAFKNALAKFPKENWQQKKVPLGLKATAWVAGFPVTNRKVQIPGTNALDFLGPQIDLGFRLSKFSTPRKFIVSGALALIILDGRDRCERPGDIKLYFDGTESLKGVIDGVPYPIVYCDMKDGVANYEEQLLGIEREEKPDILKAYLREFLDETSKLIRPFIDGDSDEKYRKIPEAIVRLRDQMRSEESEREYLVDGESEGPEVTGAPTEVKSEVERPQQSEEKPHPGSQKP